MLRRVGETVDSKDAVVKSKRCLISNTICFGTGV